MPAQEVHNHFTAARISPLERTLKYAQRREVCFVWGEASCGQLKGGLEGAPALVCTDEFLAEIHKSHWRSSIRRVPQVLVPLAEENNTTKVHRPICVARTCDNVAEAVTHALADGQFPVMIGGDHSLAMGSVSATARFFQKRGAETALVWFDAHADINTVATSPSGNMHGMPVAALLGLDDITAAPGFEDNRFATVKPNRVAWIGLRDVDPGEVETLQRLGVKAAFYMKDINEFGMTKIVEMALDAINPDRTLPIHLSFDVDGMDPMDAPSTGTTVPEGVRVTEAVELVRTLRATGCLAAMDIVEINPSLGGVKDVETTVANSRLIIAHSIGAGNTPQSPITKDFPPPPVATSGES